MRNLAVTMVGANQPMGSNNRAIPDKTARFVYASVGSGALTLNVKQSLVGHQDKPSTANEECSLARSNGFMANKC